MSKFAWMDAGKYVSHAAPATMFLQYATDEPFMNAAIAKRYFEIVSEPKKLKIYEAPHALNAEATRDRIAFLAAQLAFKVPAAAAVAAIPVLVHRRGRSLLNRWREKNRPEDRPLQKTSNARMAI
jgi:hypothetical protein